MELQDFIRGMTPTFILTILLSTIGGIIWLIRLEGRITLLFEKIVALTQAAEDKNKLNDRYMHSQFESILTKINELARRFERVESRLDTITSGRAQSNASSND